MSSRLYYTLLFVAILGFRLCHSGILWVEEGYPLAAAREMAAGKMLYRDIWFDKPPLFPAVYLLWGAMDGWVLRVAGAGYVLLSAWAAGRFARQLWGEREERMAAALMAFALTFWIPSAVMVLGPDLLLIPIQIAAVAAAWRGQALAAGLLCGFGMLVNGKMLLLLPAAVVLRPVYFLGLIGPQWMLAPVAAEYWRQVWAWGMVYSRDTFLSDAVREGLQRTANWAGFHAAAVIGAGCALWKNPRRWQWLLWIACALAAVTAGFRFFPRYYFLLLPPVVLLASRTIAARPWLLFLLLIPLARFGPRYIELGADLVSHRPHAWRDLAMEQDSRAAAGFLRGKGGTMLVWGYRPELYPLSGLPAGTRFLDSQPLTGVLADRHLGQSKPSAPALAAANRRELVTTRPDWIVDGLGPFNSELAIGRFEDLRGWLEGYAEVYRTGGTVIYRRR